MDISSEGGSVYHCRLEKLDERSIRLKVVPKDLQWNDIILGDVNVTLAYTQPGCLQRRKTKYLIKYFPIAATLPSLNLYEDPHYRGR
jgi:hypothetical protein